MTTIRPLLRATLYTDEIDDHAFGRVTGYVHDDDVWAVVDIANLSLVAKGDAGLAGMRRLRTALDLALLQARRAQDDVAVTP